ncbi:MAG: tetratricopeptide repeat protein [Oscillatoriales cyanobacterium C42_A2020_001]|nr:tetratricopeptide repeat protein [Leptolyngbyaceae cyanobacterium C42_A2020_001]
MLDQVTAAFARQDYETASQLLRELVKQSPHDPWVKLYLARLQEVNGKVKAAEEIYRQLLQSSTNSKLISQARQGLQRLATLAKERRQQAIAQATAEPGSQAPGFLILEAVTGEARSELAKRFAQLLNTDAYTARGLLPSRGWRLYRAGLMGELAVFGQELRKAGIPAFWAAIADLQSIQVFQVNYVQALQPKAAVVCQNQANQVGMLSFEWSEVQQRVEGLLPLFSQVVDLGYRDRLEWKEHIEDYAHIWDLHLPARRCILRLQDGKYDFRQGITAQREHDTVRQRWNELVSVLNQSIPPGPVQADFTIFSESTSDFVTAIERLPSHLFLSRSSDCYLDSAFHLYSCLSLLKLSSSA